MENLFKLIEYELVDIVEKQKKKKKSYYITKPVRNLKSFRMIGE